uniref:Septum-promoting GTP-binding protein 1 n=1 Tax=Anthurium amnicola TaxID=1678845 RepID=A0A1D1YUS7_9ARAE
MTQLQRALVRLGLKRTLTGHLTLFRRLLRFLRDRVLACSAGSPRRYRRLGRCPSATHDAAAALPGELAVEAAATIPGCSDGHDGDSDLVALKISLLGDCHIGKTTFMTKYVGDLEEQRGLQMAGLNLMDKILYVKGARIAFSIWDVKGDHQFLCHIPISCKDAAAIVIMFDLTSRCTLNNAIRWYQEARKWNKTAIPILIGTKFDDFIHLPLGMQWIIVIQARVYAKAMRATLFFSSATHNINVNKVFKFITAKHFNLPWSLERNLTIGEPIVDF